jgi:hypothetical protein
MVQSKIKRKGAALAFLIFSSIRKIKPITAHYPCCCKNVDNLMEHDLDKCPFDFTGSDGYLSCS